MPPPSVIRSVEKSSCANSGAVEQRVEQRVHAGERGEAVLAQFLDEARDVARIGDQHVLAAERHEDEAVRGERKDVIQRQRRDDDFAPARVEERRNPGRACRRFATMLPVQEHRALGHAGRARRCTAGMRCPRGRAATGRAHACGPPQARRDRRTAPGSVYAGTIFLTRRSTRSTSRPFKPSMSPIEVTTTWRTAVSREHRLQGVGEILDARRSTRRPSPSAGARARARCRAD